MNTHLIVTIVIALILVIMLVAIVIKHRRGGTEWQPNYRALFIIGITWLPIGIATGNPGLWGSGAVMMIAGLANRKKWVQPKRWADLSAEDKRLKLMVIGGVLILLLLGILAYFIQTGYSVE